MAQRGDRVREEQEITYGVTAEAGERETVLRFDPVEDTWHLWTCDPTIAKRWLRRGYPVQVDGTVNGVARTWEVFGLRARAIRWGPLEVSEAQRKAGQRVRAMRGQGQGKP